MCDKYKVVCSIYSEDFCEDLKYFFIKCVSPEKSGRYGSDSPEPQGSWGNLEYDEVRAGTREMMKLCIKKSKTPRWHPPPVLQRQKSDLSQPQRDEHMSVVPVFLGRGGSQR